MFSRHVPLPIGLTAAALAFLLMLAGAFHAADLGAQQWLGYPATPQILSYWVEAAAILTLALLTSHIILGVENRRIRHFLLAATGLQPVCGMAVAALAGTWFSPFASICAIIFSVILAGLYQFSALGKKNRRLQSLFSDNMAPVSLGFLAKQPEPGIPVESAATVLDARLDSSDWQTLQVAADFFKNRDAWVEIQAGNRLLVLFNAPLHDSSHSLHATGAALDFLEGRSGWRIGIASGALTCGVPEGTEKWQISGELLDEARSLNEANTSFGSAILLNLAAYDLVHAKFLLRPLGFLRAGAAEIYEPLCPLESATPDLLKQRDHFWQGIIYQRQSRQREALTAFRQAGNDAVTRHFLGRLDETATPKSSELQACG